MRPFGSKSEQGKTLQLVQRGTDKRIPVELVKQPTGEVLDPAELEGLHVMVSSDSGAGMATIPYTIEDGKLVVEITADISRQLGLGVYTMTATGRIPDPAYADGYHDYEIVVDLCKVTKYGSNETPVKVQANVLEGLKGKDGESAYEIVVKHGYQGTEEQFAKDIIPKSNYERAKELQGFEGTEVDYLVSLHGAQGKDLYQAAVERGYKGSFDDFLEQQKGAPGAPGKSNYELAQEDGFTGTLTEYLVRQKGEKGKDAYDDYLETTTDNPKLTREEWARPRSNNGNAEEGMNKTEIELLYKINNGTGESTPENTTAGSQLLEADSHRRNIINALRSKGAQVSDDDGLEALEAKIGALSIYVPIIFKQQQFIDLKDKWLPTMQLSESYRPADLSYCFARNPYLTKLPEVRGIENASSISSFANGCSALTTVSLPDLPTLQAADGAFANCSALESVTIGNLPKVTSIKSLFNGCQSLENATIGSMPKADNSIQMFYNCNLLKSVSLDLSGGEITSAEYMFIGCSKLTAVTGIIDLSKSQKTGSMFSGCSSLEEVRIKGLKTDLDLSACANLSLESVKYLVEHAQSATNKTITLHNSLVDKYDDELVTLGETATSKGWTINYR